MRIIILLLFSVLAVSRSTSWNDRGEAPKEPSASLGYSAEMAANPPQDLEIGE